MTARSTIPILLAIAALAATSEARQTTPRPGEDDGPTALLIDSDLQPRLVRLVAIESGSVVYLDEQGRRKQSLVSGLAAVLPSAADLDPELGVGATGRGRHTRDPQLAGPPRAASDDGGGAELTDGQFFPGEHVPTSGDAESMIWQHAFFGHMTFPLDRLSRVVMRGGPVSPPGLRREIPVEDELILANGDRLSGLVIDLGDPVQIESANATVEVTPQRIAEVVFANPPSRAGGVIVWLSDGTVASVGSLSSNAARQLSLTLPGGESAIYDLQSLRAVAFDGLRLLPLSSLTPGAQTPIGERRRAQPVRLLRHPDDEALLNAAAPLNAWDIELPGPMSVSYALPPGTIRLAGTAEIAPGTEPWGDCELVIAIDGAERFRRRLYSETPVAPFNIAAPGRAELTITIEPGNFGPILDRVILHRPLLTSQAPGS